MYILRSQYHALLLSLIAFAVTGQFFIVKFIINPQVINESSPLAFFLSLSAFYSLIVAGPLWIYKQWLWKIFNKHFNVKGCWRYTLTYINLTGCEVEQKFIDSLPRCGTITVKQDPFYICFVSGAEVLNLPGHDEVLASWQSTSADFASESRIVFSVEFRIGARCFEGLENMSIHLKNGKPHKLHSQFVLYDRASRMPFCHGEVYYKR